MNDISVACSSVRWPLRLAIVGCGAVVELFHLPAAQRVPEVEVVALADLDLERATDLARRFGVPQSVADYRSLVDAADAFLIATPPHVHRPIVLDILSQGKPVLCEKPLAHSAQAARDMAEAAQTSGTLLAVGHNRRFAWNLEALKELLAGGGLGKIVSVDVEDGFPFSWPTRTAYMFQSGQASRGVLMEQGVHVLDTLLWLFGPAELIEYEDDALGGIESNARLRLRLEGGIEARVWVSFTCEPRCSLRVEGEGGWAEAHFYETNQLSFEARCGKAGRALGPVIIEAEQPRDYVGLVAAQLADFAWSVWGGLSPRSDGEDGARVVRLVQDAYAAKAGRPLPTEIPLPGATW